MPTIIEVFDTDEILATTTDGRGMIRFRPRKDKQKNGAFAFVHTETVRTDDREEHYDYIREGAIVVHDGVSIGVIYEEFGWEAKYWPLTFQTKAKTLSRHMRMMFGYVLDDMYLPQEGPVLAHEKPLKDLFVDEVYVNNQRLHQTHVCRGHVSEEYVGNPELRMGYIVCPIEPKERPTLKHIPGLQTPTIDCDDILPDPLCNSSMEETLSDKCLKALFVQAGMMLK